ncbi:MAG TPA: transposase [Verrucomicrobiae bacterium]|nr:transposase [Verrucomicrobiae bacterium]
MSDDVRINRADRSQPRFDVVDLESQLGEDHRARTVWEFVSGLDLSEFYARIRARGETAGRPATDPKILLALWLYATLEGVGSARALNQLCSHHIAYRWLCGGVEVNHNILAEFRVESGVLLDRLLTQSLTALIAAGVVTLEEAAIDGTKVRASASKGSLSGAGRLSRMAAAVEERIKGLKRELQADPAASQRRAKKRALDAAEERARRVEAAKAKLAELEAERAERQETHAAEEAQKSEPKASTTDSEARMMKFPDGAMRLAYNVQVATSRGFVIAVEPTDRRNDKGLAPMLVEQIKARCAAVPGRLLADTGAMTQDDIARLAETYPGMTIFSPPPKEKDDVKEETRRKRAWKLRQQPTAVRDWRERMAGDEARSIYARRKNTEHAHAHMKNRGFATMLVRGIAKVRAVCLLHALAHNLACALSRRASVPT